MAATPSSHMANTTARFTRCPLGDEASPPPSSDDGVAATLSNQRLAIITINMLILVLKSSTISVCLRTDFKSTFNYYAIFNAAGKVHFAPIARGKTDGESLLRLEWHKKFDSSYARKQTIFAPLKQRSEHFVEDNYPRYQRRVGKMAWQAWMISANHPARFKGHSRSFRHPPGYSFL